MYRTIPYHTRVPIRRAGDGGDTEGGVRPHALWHSKMQCAIWSCMGTQHASRSFGIPQSENLIPRSATPPSAVLQPIAIPGFIPSVSYPWICGALRRAVSYPVSYLVSYPWICGALRRAVSYPVSYLVSYPWFHTLGFIPGFIPVSDRFHTVPKKRWFHTP